MRAINSLQSSPIHSVPGDDEFLELLRAFWVRERIRRLKWSREPNLTYVSAAKYVGVSYTSIGHWLTGHRNPTRNNLVKLLDLLLLHPDDKRGILNSHKEGHAGRPCKWEAGQ